MAGSTLHVWERPDQPPERRVVLAYAQVDPFFLVGADERILSEVLATADREAPSTTTPLLDHARAAIAEPQSLHAPTAAVLDVHAFPLFRTPEWVHDGLGVDFARTIADRLAAMDDTTSATIAALCDGARAAARRAHHGGFSDLQRLELLYWPDPSLPHSRVRLVFSDDAHSWMSELATRKPSRLPDLAIILPLELDIHFIDKQNFKNT